MRIQITAGGIYNADGEEIPLGTELTVSKEPLAWAGRYNVLSGGGEGKTLVTNPAEGGPKGPFTVKDDGNGWHGVYGADGEKVKSLRKDDADAFAGLSEDDQAAFLTEA
jgi:hypothetical protein